MVPMKLQMLAIVPILSLFLAPLANAEVKPLMIYGVSIGEERVAAVKFAPGTGSILASGTASLAGVQSGEDSRSE